MGQFCPRCGFNLTADEPVRLGRWTVSVDEARLDGDILHLTSCEVLLLHAVAAMHPRPVRRSAVRERVSSAENADNIVSVMICRLRRKLGADMPVETVRGVGLRWIDGPAREAA